MRYKERFLVFIKDKKAFFLFSVLFSEAPFSCSLDSEEKFFRKCRPNAVHVSIDGWTGLSKHSAKCRSHNRGIAEEEGQEGYYEIFRKSVFLDLMGK